MNWGANLQGFDGRSRNMEENCLLRFSFAPQNRYEFPLEKKNVSVSRQIAGSIFSWTPPFVPFPCLLVALFVAVRPSRRPDSIACNSISRLCVLPLLCPGRLY